ncbi:MAG: hypothetical protein GF313_00350 [Caldithrix sp.]|nr:hypothetical protein [Caldithrix sp.]
MAQNAKSETLRSFLPESVDGWQAEHSGKVYGRDNLYEHINGGAELYLSYKFSAMINRVYMEEGQPDIIIDIFDMGKPENAFGVFMHSRETVDTTFGQGSESVPGMIHFWRNRYFVSILAYPQTEASDAALKKLAKTVHNRIGKDGLLPQIITRLPNKNLIPSTIRYFTHHVWLNSYFFIAEENILQIEDATHCVLAKYNYDQKKAVLLICQYTDKEQARSARDRFIASYNPQLEVQNSLQEEDDTWISFKQDMRSLAIVFKAPHRQQAEKLLQSVTNLEE